MLGPELKSGTRITPCANGASHKVGRRGKSKSRSASRATEYSTGKLERRLQIRRKCGNSCASPGSPICKKSGRSGVSEGRGPGSRTIRRRVPQWSACKPNRRPPSPGRLFPGRSLGPVWMSKFSAVSSWGSRSHSSRFNSTILKRMLGASGAIRIQRFNISSEPSSRSCGSQMSSRTTGRAGSPLC